MTTHTFRRGKSSREHARGRGLATHVMMRVHEREQHGRVDAARAAVERLQADAVLV